MKIETDREKVPLMKALHELGLAHGVRFVVVATPMDGKGSPTTMLIDHKDGTTKEEATQAFVNAGVLLILSAGRVSEMP